MLSPEFDIGFRMNIQVLEPKKSESNRKVIELKKVASLKHHLLCNLKRLTKVCNVLSDEIL